MEATKDSSAQPDRETLFEPFEWVNLPHNDPNRSLAQFASLVLDVTQGVETLIAIAERDDIDGSCGDESGRTLPALLGRFEHGNLQRLARASLSMLAQHADEVITKSSKGAQSAPRA